MDALFAAIQDSAAGAYVRDSVYLYPAANVLHVLAVLAFFASVAAMDLRLLGAIRGEPAKAVIARLRPVSIGAALLILASGATLFVPEAVALARNGAFQLKMAAVAIGLINVAVNERAMRRQGEASLPARSTAALSLALWLAVAALGRLIAYV